MNYEDKPILDSGERRQFYDENGNPLAVRDCKSGAGRFDLLPWNAIWDLAKHCEKGAAKYGDNNSRKGLLAHSLYDSAIRHLTKWYLGWDDENHILAALWNVAWLVEQTHTHPELDDIHKPGNTYGYTPKENSNDVDNTVLAGITAGLLNNTLDSNQSSESSYASPIREN